AWVISMAFHVVLLTVLAAVAILFGGKPAAATENQDTQIDTKLDEEEQQKNFENPDIGLDPNLPTNYNIDRIEDVSVPGPLKPEEKVGNNGENETPVTVPPPPGIVTDSSAQGGGVASDLAGTGALGPPG